MRERLTGKSINHAEPRKIRRKSGPGCPGPARNKKAACHCPYSGRALVTIKESGQRFFKAIAEMLLADSDDLVQKGYGWMLKAVSQAHPAEMFDYRMPRKGVMPRTAFRYGLEKMPAERRARAMQK